MKHSDAASNFGRVCCHCGSPTIEESPDGWFEFDPGTGTINRLQLR